MGEHARQGSHGVPASAAAAWSCWARPISGSIIAVQALAGVASFVTKLGKLKGLRDRDDLLKVVLSFPGLYQLLPAPDSLPDANLLYQGRTYSDLPSVDVEVPQRYLTAALKFHKSLRTPIGCDRIYTILGYGQPTFSGIKDMTRLDHLDAYSATGRGDGVVTLDMARLDGAVNYFVAEEHAGLTSNHEVLAAIDELLAHGGTERLGGDPGPFEEARHRPASGTSPRAGDAAIGRIDSPGSTCRRRGVIASDRPASRGIADARPAQSPADRHPASTRAVDLDEAPPGRACACQRSYRHPGLRVLSNEPVQPARRRDRGRALPGRQTLRQRA